MLPGSLSRALAGLIGRFQAEADARGLQAALVLGALEWMYTLGGLVALRMELGQPVARMALILGGVAVFTAASALVFQSAPMARRHRIAGVSGGAG